jgi:hypothetical protein
MEQSDTEIGLKISYGSGQRGRFDVNSDRRTSKALFFSDDKEIAQVTYPHGASSLLVVDMLFDREQCTVINARVVVSVNRCVMQSTSFDAAEIDTPQSCDCVLN